MSDTIKDCASRIIVTNSLENDHKPFWEVWPTGCSTRTINILEQFIWEYVSKDRNEATFANVLLRFEESKFFRIRGCGRKTITDIKNVLWKLEKNFEDKHATFIKEMLGIYKDFLNNKGFSDKEIIAMLIINQYALLTTRKISAEQTLRIIVKVAKEIMIKFREQDKSNASV